MTLPRCKEKGLSDTPVSLHVNQLSILTPCQPEVLFLSNKKELRLRPKSEIIKVVKQTIINLPKKYGFQSENYFIELEKVSVKYWLE
jgi:hypothetical protein